MIDINKALNTNNLMNLFGVSHMTIGAWRKGSTTRAPLPTVEIKGHPRLVGFKPSEVKTWAKKYGFMLSKDPALLLGSAIAKPGPKAKASPVVKKAKARDQHVALVEAPNPQASS